MGTHEVSPRNRAERRRAGKGAGRKARAAGAALTAGSAALAMGAAWVGPDGLQSAGAAAPIEVSTANDAGAGSLRQAVLDANAAGGADTITFAPALSGQTITLTSGAIPITGDLTITGPGASALTISGDDNDRIFDVTGSAVTISGLTFTHGFANGGGAISADGSSPLTISGSTFTANESTAGGGAINTDSGITIDGSTFTENNSDDWGGAILMAGGTDAVVSNSTFGQNRADGGGGGLASNSSDSITVANSTFDGNFANQNGGGIVTYATKSTVSGSTFTDNEADENGGGLHFSSTDVANISGSTFTGNRAQNLGGGISLDEIDGGASIEGVALTENEAYEGGGIALQNMSAGVTIANSNISGNHTGSYGGGIYATNVDSFLDITNTTISQNTADGGGGGLSLWGRWNDTAVTVTATTISGNQAGFAGGGWLQWAVGGTTTFNNSTISGNVAGRQGGGIYFYGFYGLTVNMSTVTDNHATDSTGGIFLGIDGGHNGELEGAAKAADHAKRDGVHEKGAKAHAAETFGDASIAGTILWGNSGNDLGEAGLASLGHTLLGTVAAGITVTDQGGNLTGVDPMLGPLADNGGATQTHALLIGSPAIDAGPDPVPAFAGNELDQRGEGFVRVAAGTADIGAFEVQPPPVLPSPVVIQPKFTG
jgi:predicted outer membrane repeat protein